MWNVHYLPFAYFEKQLKNIFLPAYTICHLHMMTYAISAWQFNSWHFYSLSINIMYIYSLRKLFIDIKNLLNHIQLISKLHCRVICKLYKRYYYCQINFRRSMKSIKKITFNYELLLRQSQHVRVSKPINWHSSANYSRRHTNTSKCFLQYDLWDTS